MITINGREATSQEVCDIVSALREKAEADDERAVECAGEAAKLVTERHRAGEHEGLRRLAFTFKSQAERGRKLADEIEE